jgi:uncharacterized protein YndB with AHSA1/START domain
MHMSEATTVNTDLDARQMTVERVFNAPRELVFKAWSDAESLSHWWGPRDWTLSVCNIDFRPGGTWHYCMQGPDGEQSWGKATYVEIHSPSRIVYSDAFSDEQGNVSPGTPLIKVSIELVDEGGKTRLVGRAETQSREELESLLQMGMVEGMKQSLDRLEEFLARS